MSQLIPFTSKPAKFNHNLILKKETFVFFLPTPLNSNLKNVKQSYVHIR